MEAERVGLQIAALLDKANVDQARIGEAITELKPTGIALSQDVTNAAAGAVTAAFTGLQGDIERARGAMRWFSNRWFFITVATLAGLGVLAFFMMWVALVWQRDEVAGLLTQRAEITAQIAQLEGQGVTDTAGMRAFRQFQLQLPMPNCAVFEVARHGSQPWRMERVQWRVGSEYAHG